MFKKTSRYVSPYRNKQEEGLGTLAHYRAESHRAMRHVWYIFLIALLILSFIVFTYSRIDGNSFLGQWVHIYHVMMSVAPGRLNTHEIK